MAPNTKRVFYVNALSAPVYIDILAKRPDVQLDKLVNDSPEAEAVRVLSQAHAYQIGSSRQELAMQYQGYTPLLLRCPNLVVLSTNGAGFDTVSLADATAAGVAVVNQAGTSPAMTVKSRTESVRGSACWYYWLFAVASGPLGSL